MVRSPAHALERLSLLVLVGSGVFEFVTGIINIQLWVPYGFYFVPAHYYGALVFIVAFVAARRAQAADDAPRLSPFAAS